MEGGGYSGEDGYEDSLFVTKGGLKGLYGYKREEETVVFLGSVVVVSWRYYR